MFCNKCGKQLPDNAAFCSGCGNQIAAAPAPGYATQAPAPAGEMPLTIKRLLGQFVAFFTKKDPIAVVNGSAHDKSFSGLIVAVFGMLMMALGTMVNVNQGYLAASKAAYKDYGLSWSDKIAKEVAKTFPSGISFGMTLLAVAVVYIAVAAMLFVVANYVAKKPLSLSGACNIVAYASIPMIGASIVNMLAGLIWFVLPVVFMLVAGVVTLILLSAGLNHVCGSDKPSMKNNMVFFIVIAVVALIFAWIALKAINNAKDAEGVITSIIRLWIPVD